VRALLQRVDQASVTPPGSAIGRGLLILLGVGHEDTEAEGERLAEKIVNLRVFSNDAGKFDLSLLDVKGEALVVSQFTLFGSAKGGRRPDFTAAARPEPARALYEAFCRALGRRGVAVKTGEFGAAMKVALVNDGPVTLWLDTVAL